MNRRTYPQALYESKEHLIKRLDCDQQTKDYFINFFKTHTNLESDVDWNLKGDALITDIFNLINTTKDNKVKTDKIHNIYKNKQAFTQIDWEDNNCEPLDQTDKSIFISFLNKKGAEFCDSPKCGGSGAKWCIGEKGDDTRFSYYICTLDDIFIMQLNKNPDDVDNELKIMWEISGNHASAWSQPDKTLGKVTAAGTIFPSKFNSQTVAIPTENQIEMMTDFAHWFTNHYKCSYIWERVIEIFAKIKKNNYDMESFDILSEAIQDSYFLTKESDSTFSAYKDDLPYIEWETPADLMGAGEFVVHNLCVNFDNENLARQFIHKLNFELFTEYNAYIRSISSAYHEYADNFSSDYAISFAPENFTIENIKEINSHLY